MLFPENVSHKFFISPECTHVLHGKTLKISSTDVYFVSVSMPFLRDATSNVYLYQSIFFRLWPSLEFIYLKSLLINLAYMSRLLYISWPIMWDGWLVSNLSIYRIIKRSWSSDVSTLAETLCLRLRLMKVVKTIHRCDNIQPDTATRPRQVL